MNEQEMELKNLIPIYINGQRYKVPEGITILQAYEYAGFQLIRGCGCRGGVCGACATIFRVPDDNKVHTCLACQTMVQKSIQVSMLLSFPVNKATYDLEAVKPEESEILELYPEILNCMGCNACTQSCPMDINVMEGVSGLLRGDIEKVAIDTLTCTMCGLCAARCPAGLSPYLYFLLCRRIYGKHIMVPLFGIAQRISEIKGKKYDEELNKLMQLDTESLKKIYQDAQSDKRII